VIRRILLACSFALLIPLGIPDAARAEEPKASEQPTKPETPEQWRAKILAAKRVLASAQQRHETALRAYQIMRHRRHPRGEGKQAIMDELAQASDELAMAQANLEKVEAAAHHAGATPNWFEFKPEEINPPGDVPAAAKP